MAKIPDITALGQRPTPSPASNVVPRTGTEGIVGQSLRNLGAGLMSAGEDLYGVYQKEKQKQDRIAAEGALNDLRTKQDELTIGEKGFVTIKGKNALDNKWQKDYTQQFDDYQGVLADGLQNDEQRQLFNERANVARVQYNENMLRHRMQETEKHADEVFGSTVNLEVDAAAKSWRDDPSMEVSKLRVKNAINEQGERKGWDDAIKADHYKKTTTAIYTTAIQQAVDNHDLDRAKAMYYSHKADEIDPQVYGKIEDLIKAGDVRLGSQKLADEITSDPKITTMQQAIEVAKKKSSGEELDATVSRIKDYFGTKDASAQLVQKQAGDSAWAIYSETKDFDKIPISILRAMDGRQREELRAYAEKIKAGVGIKTDPLTYYQLRKLYASDNGKFRSINMMTYQPKLSESDFQEMVKLQTDDKGVQVFQSKENIFKQALGTMNLDPKEEFKNSNDGKKIREFSDRIDSEIIQFNKVNGRYPTLKEMNEIIDRQTINVVKEKYRILGIPIPFTGDETPAARAKVEGVPDDMVDDIAEAIVKSGGNPTVEEIQKQYLYFSGGKAK